MGCYIDLLTPGPLILHLALASQLLVLLSLLDPAPQLTLPLGASEILQGRGVENQKVNASRKVLVAMSGGVDSSVTAALLKKEGWEVRGVHFLLPCLPETRKARVDSVRRVAEHIGIPLELLDLAQTFTEKIIDPFVQGYRKGLTPNPCVVCNETIKFEHLLKEADAREIPFIASGHYARVRPRGALFELWRGADPKKEQSYFLHRLGQRQLSRILFPLGDLRKTEVRRMAEGLGLPLPKGGESQEICFVPGNDYRSYLESRGEGETARKGLILDQEGTKVGEHSGTYRYTIGQRHGLGIASARPYYVMRIEAEENRIVVGRKEDLYSRQVEAEGASWVSGEVSRRIGRIAGSSSLPAPGRTGAASRPHRRASHLRVRGAPVGHHTGTGPGHLSGRAAPRRGLDHGGSCMTLRDLLRKHVPFPARRCLPLIALLIAYGVIGTLAMYPHTVELGGKGLLFDSRASDAGLSAPKELHERDESALKEFSFSCRLMFYSTDKEQTVLQTADDRRGIRIEMNPPGSLQATVRLAERTWMNEIMITKDLRPDTWYELAFSISRDKEIECSFNNARFRLPQKQDDVYYSLSHIVFGRMDGKIADMNIRYRFWNGLFPIETVLIVFTLALISWHIRGRFAGDRCGLSGGCDKRFDGDHHPLLRLSFAFLATLVALTLVAICIQYLVHFPPPPPPDELRRDLLVSLSPEPRERLQYVTLVLLAPFLSFGFYRLFRKSFLHAPPTAGLLAASAGVLLILLLVFTGITKVDFLYLGRTAAFANPWYLFLGPVLVLLALHLYERRKSRGFLFPALSHVSVGLLVLFTILSTICQHNTLSSAVFYHFEAVFYPLSQIMQGKTLLVDFQNQYGLYPHFLEPVFRVVGISALTFSITMATLSGATLLLLYVSLRKVLHHGLFALLGIFVFFLFARVIPPAIPFDPYFQNMPIRTLFPAILFFLTISYLGRPSFRARSSLFLAAGLGLLWNQDAGVVSLVSVIATLFYKDFCHMGIRRAVIALIGNLILTAVAIGLVLAAYGAFAFLRSSSWPDYGRMLTYQGIFYGAGYNCLPMKLLHPWNALALVYLVAMVYAVHRRHEGNASLGTCAVVYFTILGCGIFSYFQGRSHDLNLTAVAYPAVFILLILARELWGDAAEGKALSFSRGLLLSLILVFFGYVLLTFIGSQDRIAADLRRGMAALGHRWCAMEDDVQFIKDHTRPGERIFIDSGKHMGVLYAETRTANPVNTPGFTELVLQKDLDENLDFLEQKKSAKIFAHLEDLEYLWLLRRPILFRVEGMSRSSEMALLHRLEPEKEGEDKDANPPSFALLPPLPYTFDFSLEMTFRPEATPSKSGRIIGNGSELPHKRGLSLIHKEGDEYVFEEVDGKRLRMSSTFRMEPGRSHHLRIVCRQREYFFYHNERLVGSMPFTRELGGERALLIGHGAEKGVQVFEGSITNVSVRVLPPEEAGSRPEALIHSDR